MGFAGLRLWKMDFYTHWTWRLKGENEPPSIFVSKSRNLALSCDSCAAVTFLSSTSLALRSLAQSQMITVAGTLIYSRGSNAMIYTIISDNKFRRPNQANHFFYFFFEKRFFANDFFFQERQNQKINERICFQEDSKLDLSDNLIPKSSDRRL